MVWDEGAAATVDFLICAQQTKACTIAMATRGITGAEAGWYGFASYCLRVPALRKTSTSIRTTLLINAARSALLRIP
jgi:hypothetical protein